MATAATIDRDLVQLVERHIFDPLGYAVTAFPWGEGPLESAKGPRQWQGDVLATIANHLKDKDTRFQPLRIAIGSGHGIGKSALVGMASKWAMDCWPNARVVITANTEQQLITKTSPEVAKWHRMVPTRDWFKIATMKISSTEAPDNWRLDFVTWSANNTEAFAGLHNVGNIILVITDESSSIDDRVAEVIEGALTDEGTVLIWLALGNPTRNTGWFHQAFTRYRHRWILKQIDARDVEGTNKEYLRELVDTYGIESDIVKVRVLGQFPSTSTLQFIGTGTVAAAQERVIDTGAILPSDPVVFGLDHARFGDDTSVLAIRQGRDARSRSWLKWNGATSMQIAGDLNEAMRRYLPDAVFIDAGGPNAGGVIDRLRQLNPEFLSIFEINFGSHAKDMEARWNSEVRVKVANKRAQMWTNMRAWLERGMIPDERELADDLTGVEYSYNVDNAIQLEKKEHMKKRGLASPDNGDALCFEGSTLVATPRGQRRIDSLRIGERVLTPFGTAMIKLKWVSAADSVTTARFSNGSTLRGKGEHKVFTFNRGAVRLDALTLTDGLDMLSPLRRLAWKIVKWSSTAGPSLGFKHLVDITRATFGVTTRSGCFIVGCGLMFTALSRKIMTSTTRMVTGATMPLAISSASSGASTGGNTCSRGPPPSMGEPASFAGLRQRGPRPPNGTDRPKVSRGIGVTANKLGWGASRFPPSASNAEPDTKPIFQPAPPTARPLAPSKWAFADISRISASAASAANRLWQTATGLRPIVPVAVATAPVPHPEPMYNLTLDRDNAYYANGILVFNCLTFAEDVQPRELPEYLNPSHYGREKEYDRYSELPKYEPIANDYDRSAI